MENTRLKQTDMPSKMVHHRHMFSNTNAIQTGLSADRPTTPTEYLFYMAQDTGVLSFWNGQAWLSVTLS